jgi:hypothetical protein
MWPIVCPETSVQNYHSTLRNIPEESRSQGAYCLEHWHFGFACLWRKCTCVYLPSVFVLSVGGSVAVGRFPVEGFPPNAWKTSWPKLSRLNRQTNKKVEEVVEEEKGDVDKWVSIARSFQFSCLFPDDISWPCLFKPPSSLHKRPI